MRVIAGGATFELGTTETTPTIGIVDYSRRETDQFGVTTVVERGFSRRMSVRLALPFGEVDRVQRRLAALRTAAATWEADDRFAWLRVKGYYKDFTLDLATDTLAYCTLTIEGTAETEVAGDPGADPAVDGRSTMRVLAPVALSSGMLISSSLPENDAAAWVPGTSYAVGARVVRAHRVFESLRAANVDEDPSAQAGGWLDTGPTNRWAMFDQALGTVAAGAGEIRVVLEAGTIDAIALVDVSGATVRVQVDGYDRTVAVGEGALTFLDLPLTAARATVTVVGPGPVSVGTLLIGRVFGLGETEASPTAGITDFSRKEVDEFGEVTVVPRAWAKRMEAKAEIRADAVDMVANRIAALRARPALWIGFEGLDSLTVYGFWKDFSIQVGATASLSLSIDGLSTAAKVEGLKLGVDWEDVRDPTGTKPTNNADKTSENTAKNTAAVGNRTAEKVNADLNGNADAIETQRQRINELIDSYGDTIGAEAAKEAAEAARDAARLAQDNAIVASTDAAGSILSPGLSPQAWTYNQWNDFAPTEASLRKAHDTPGSAITLVGGKARVVGGFHVHPYRPQPIDPNRNYRPYFRGRILADGATSSNHALYCTFWDKDGNVLSGNTVLVASREPGAATVATGTFEITTTLIPKNIAPGFENAAFARIMYRTISAGTTEMDMLYLDDVDGATRADGSATASAGSARDAKASETEAGKSATAAEASFTKAEAENRAARGHAETADERASAANDSASAALASQRISAGFSATRGLTPNGGFTEGVVGTATVPGWRHTGGVPFVYGQHYSGLGIRTTGYTAFYSGRRDRVDTTRTYRLRGLFVVHAPADNTNYFGLACFNAAGVHIGNTYVVPADGVPYPGTPNGVHRFSSDYTGEADFTYAHSRRFIRGTVYVEAFGLLNYPEGRPNAPTEVNELYLDDVTSAVDSAANAVLARDEKVAAQQGAASAASSALAAASVTSTGINRGGIITTWADGAPAPAYATPWANGGGYRVPGLLGRYAVEFDALEGREWGQEENWNTDASLANLTPNGWWVVEADIELLHGQLGGAGLHWAFYNGNNVPNGYSGALSFASHPDTSGTVRGAGVPGRRYTFTTRPFRDIGPDGTRVAFYTMANWGGFGAGLPYKRIRFHKRIIRPAYQDEIDNNRPLAEGGLRATAEQTSAAVVDINRGLAAARLGLKTEAGPGTEAEIELLSDRSGGGRIRFGGTAIFTGAIRALTTVLLGNGNGWRIALRTEAFQVSDGTNVSFGTDLGGLPRIVFSTDGLAPLNSGEAYQLRATNVTSSGFIASLRIAVPGALAAQQVGATEFSSTKPTRRALRGDRPEAARGDYEFDFTVSGDVQNLAAGEPGYYQVGYSLWVRKGGVWQQFSSGSVVFNGDFNGGSVSRQENRREAYTLGDGAEAFGIALEGTDGFGSNPQVNINAIRWQSQESSATTRSATPNGERSTAQVTPQ